MGGFSQQSASSRSFVDPSQAGFLGDLRGQAQQLASSQMQRIGGVADQLSGRLGGIGDQLLGGITDAAGSFAPGAAASIGGLISRGTGQDPITQQLLGLVGQAGTGADTLAGISTGQIGGLDLQGLLAPGAQLGGQLNALDEAIQRNLSSTLGTIGSSASLAGQTGGSREAFFARESAGEAQRAFSSEAQQLLASDLAARRGLAGTAAQLDLGQTGLQLEAGQNLLAGGQGTLGALLAQQTGALGQAGNVGLAQQAGQVGAGQAGLGNLSNLYNLGLSPFQAEFAPLQALNQIVGPATVLNQSQSSGFGVQVSA